jgi:hypothetical protein
MSTNWEKSLVEHHALSMQIVDTARPDVPFESAFIIDRMHIDQLQKAMNEADKQLKNMHRALKRDNVWNFNTHWELYQRHRADALAAYAAGLRKRTEGEHVALQPESGGGP